MIINREKRSQRQKQQHLISGIILLAIKNYLLFFSPSFFFFFFFFPPPLIFLAISFHSDFPFLATTALRILHWQRIMPHFYSATKATYVLPVKMHNGYCKISKFFFSVLGYLFNCSTLLPNLVLLFKESLAPSFPIFIKSPKTKSALIVLEPN